MRQEISTWFMKAPGELYCVFINPCGEYIFFVCQLYAKKFVQGPLCEISTSIIESTSLCTNLCVKKFLCRSSLISQVEAFKWI